MAGVGYIGIEAYSEMYTDKKKGEIGKTYSEAKLSRVIYYTMYNCIYTVCLSSDDKSPVFKKMPNNISINEKTQDTTTFRNFLCQVHKNDTIIW